MTRTPVADWQKLSALYEAADALEPVALAAWLAQLRAQAHPLLTQLEQMLAARAKVRRNDFLGAPPALPLPPEPQRPAEAQAELWDAGSRIGPYRLVCHLGEGGMAEVWMAKRDDGAFQRTVAIKLLFRSAGSSQRDSFAQRFARERDILASLDHPNIAGLHDAGVTPGGQPWLALEYIEGRTLLQWCDTQRLGIAARVRLFRQVLLAVQHAHANLVIHRDLKPGNILVTAKGEVRLLDFGIAKLMEAEGATLAETELTRMAGRPMTPQYAAPEQLLGQPLTTACDVYALGVVLYQLLCGERPYELKLDSPAQLEQSIIDIEPRGPSRRALTETAVEARNSTPAALHKALSSDLDAIVLRALAKKPANRYASAEAFRADLDRWLAGEPVEARVPSAAYRIGKFVRRHMLAVGLSAAAVLSLIGVTVVAVAMGLQAREDSARAVAARDFMLNIFQRADQEKSRGADITARDLLETGRKDVLTRLVGQPKLQAELLRGIAKIQDGMGEFATADNTYAELVRVCAELHQPREEAMARADRAYNALQMNNLTLATSLVRSAEAVSGRPTADAELNARLAEVTGRVALSSGDAERARTVLSAARQSAAKQLGQDHLRTFKLGQSLFRAERDLRNFDAALALLDELRRTAVRVPDLGSGEVGAMDFEHVNLLIGAGHYAQALVAVDAALPRCDRELGAQHASCRYLFLKKGQTLLKMGTIDDDEPSIQRLKTMVQDPTLPYLQVEALLLEFRWRAMGPLSPELALLAERVRAFGQSGAEVSMQPTFKAAALLALAEAQLRAGDPAQARQWVDQASRLLGDGVKRASALGLIANGRVLAGIALLQQGQFEDALRSLQAADADCATAYGAEHPTTQLFALNTALVLAELRRRPEALAIARHAEPLLREAFGASAPTYQQALALLHRLEGGSAVAASAEGPALDPQRSAHASAPGRGFFR